MRVRDNGMGIPTQGRGRLFEEGVSLAERSNGIGLYLVRKTMERFGVMASVEETSSIGTNFLLRLPGFKREIT